MPARHRSRARRKSGFFNRKMAALIAVIAIFTVVVAYQMVGSEDAGTRIAGTEDSGTNGGPTRVLLVTSMGNITIELYGDMPITSGNFESLTQSGTYDGTIFHRVIRDFVVQGGDASVKGISVPTIPDELPNKHNNVRGSVAMAKTNEPNSATSQFYINLKDNPHLDSNYSVFGRVIEGMAVVDAIGNVQTDGEPYNKPLQEVTLIRAEFTH